MPESVLEFKTVSKGAPKAELGVIHALSFELFRGEILTLWNMGRWERQTLIDLSTAMTPPDRGSVLFQGADLAAHGEERLGFLRGRMGVVTDPPLFLNNLRIMENLRLPLRYHGTGGGPSIDATLGEILERLGLRSFPDVIPSHFDHRFLGAAALARALSITPDLLLVERPLESLGEDLASRMLPLLEEYVTGHGGAVLLLTTVPRIALALSDRVAIFKAGTITALEGKKSFRARVNEKGSPRRGENDLWEEG